MSKQNDGSKTIIAQPIIPNESKDKEKKATGSISSFSEEYSIHPKKLSHDFKISSTKYNWLYNYAKFDRERTTPKRKDIKKRQKHHTKTKEALLTSQKIVTLMKRIS